MSRWDPFSAVPPNPDLLSFSEHLRECTMKATVCLQTAFPYPRGRRKHCLLLRGGKSLGKWSLRAAVWYCGNPSWRTPRAVRGKSWQQTPQHKRPAELAPFSPRSLWTQCRAPGPRGLPGPAGTFAEEGRRRRSRISGWAGRRRHRRAAGRAAGRAGAPSACLLLCPGPLLWSNTTHHKNTLTTPDKDSTQKRRREHHF